MKLTLLDKSNYFKGLLLLIGKDGKISEKERDVLLKVGKTLGFEREFCESSIDTMLENKYLVGLPPKFSESSFAQSFIQDGFSLALADDQICQEEISWLEKVSLVNKVPWEWFSEQLEKIKDGQKYIEETGLKAANLV
jgi:hypothetical protein